MKSLKLMPVAETVADAAQLALMQKKVREYWNGVGEYEPYWSVLTEDKYLQRNLAANCEQFYISGRVEAANLVQNLKAFGLEDASQKECLEYGCGVGRVTRSLAFRFKKVVAFDVSFPHLQLAQKNTLTDNVDFVAEIAPGHFNRFDVVYSRLVLQHNPPPIALLSIRTMLSCLAVGGVAIFQIPTYSYRYRFTVNEYLNAIDCKNMEIHFTPQASVLREITLGGCELLHMENDDSIGDSPMEVSNLFVVRRSR